MDVLTIVLVILVLAGIWVVVELAITIRKTRSSIEVLNDQVTEITEKTNNTIDEIQPMLVKVDGIITDLEPAAKEVLPLLEKANTALDVVTVDLASVNDILVDVSSVTDTASNVTSTVSKAANSAVSGVAGVVGKFTGGGNSGRRRKLAAKTSESEQVEMAPAVEDTQAPVADEVIEEPEAPKTYFTYGPENE